VAFSTNIPGKVRAAGIVREVIRQSEEFLTTTLEGGLPSQEEFYRVALAAADNG
jgi:hypothetical protein